MNENFSWREQNKVFTCSWCGKSFKPCDNPEAFQTHWGDAYCSVRCSDRSSEAAQEEYRRTHYTCEQCGRVFNPDAVSLYLPYCSQSCEDEARDRIRCHRDAEKEYFCIHKVHAYGK